MVEPLTRGTDAAGGEEHDIAREIARLEVRNDHCPDWPDEPQREGGGAGGHGGDKKREIGWEWTRLDCRRHPAQMRSDDPPRNENESKDHQRQRKPERAALKGATGPQFQQRRHKRPVLGGLRECDRDRADEEAEYEQRYTESEQISFA